MKLIILIFCYLFFNVPFNANAKPENQNNLEFFTEFSNNYRTYGDYLDAMSAIGIISQQDKSEIEKVLIKNKIKLNDRKAISKIVKNKEIQWGDTVIIFDKNQKAYRTKSGNYLRAKDGETVSERFVRILSILNGTCKNCSAWNQFLILYAEASDSKDSVYGASLDLTFWDAADLATACGVGALFTLTGGFAATLKSIIYPIKKYLYDGSVSCMDGYFVYKQMEFDLISPLKIMKEYYHEIDPDVPSPTARACYGAIKAGFGNIVSLFYQEAMDCPWDKQLGSCHHIVSKSVLKKVFGDKVPACNKESAFKVHVAVKEKLRETEKSLYTGLNFNDLRKSINPGRIKSSEDGKIPASK